MVRKNNPKSNNTAIKNKFLELMSINAKLYNGYFSPDIFLDSTSLSNIDLAEFNLNKYDDKNNLINRLQDNENNLNVQQLRDLIFIKDLIGKLINKQVLVQGEDRYIKFINYYNENYLKKLLSDKGFSDEEIEIVVSVSNKIRKAVAQAKLSIRNPINLYTPEIVDELKKQGLIHINKKKPEKYIYWKQCWESIDDLKNKLNESGFNNEEQDLIIKSWLQSSKIGFDLTGLQYIDNNIAIYNKNSKLNNWTLENSEWITNSTAICTTGGKTPYTGVSIIRNEDDNEKDFKTLRKGEVLHSHPNLQDIKQTEVYLITSGSATLLLRKNGKEEYKNLKQGELAVISPGTEHCVHGASGGYEHIVIQTPSTFQYSFGFKIISN